MAAEVQSTPHRQALEQWHRIEQRVQVWLRERRELLALLCSLQGLCGLGADRLPVPQRVQRFCEVLMDYISAGHFEIYRDLAAEAQQLRGADPALVEHVMHRLERSTDAALAFNEEYDTPEHVQQLLDALPDRLTELLEQLEERFALEDQLILSIHTGALARH